PELAAEADKTASGTNSPNAVTGQAATRSSQPSGILNLVADLFALARKRRTLDLTVSLTDALQRSSEKLQAPFVSNLTAIVERGDQLAKEADSSDPTQLGQQKRELDTLAAKFKQVSTVALPLKKQSTLFELYKGSLGRWRDSVKDRSSV